MKLGTRAANVFTDSTALTASVLTAAPQRPLVAPLLLIAALTLLVETLITDSARAGKPRKWRFRSCSTPSPRCRPIASSSPAFLRSARPITIGGLPGSSDATLSAALGRELGSTRFQVILAEALPEAERWLADLDALAVDGAVALYPPREGFGEVEPHLEVAGERVETLERVARGEVRTLVTTARAILERTRLPAAVRNSRLELHPGDTQRLDALIAHLESVGFERVTLVDDVAQFSVRGGIVDIYSFGMANPVRIELWGDEISSLRHFDLATQRSTRDAASAVILPVDGRRGEDDESAARGTVADLFPPDTLIVVPARSHLDSEMRRTWEEAAHHIDLARRRGEDVPNRDELFQTPEDAQQQLARFGRIAILHRDAATDGGARSADIVFPIRPPDAVDRDIKRLRRLVADGMPTVILCDNVGQCERLDEILNEDARAPSPAALTVGVVDGGFIVPGARASEPGLRILTDHEIFRRERRIRRHRRYGSGSSLESITALKPGDYVVHLEHGVGIYRGIEQVFVRESTIEVAVIEYEGGDRLNVPLYRIDQVERYRSADDVSSDSPPPRLHKLGGKRWAAAARQDARRAAGDDARAARSLCAPPRGGQDPRLPGHDVAAPARVVLSLRGHARSAQGDRRGQDGHGVHASDGSPARGRRRLRKDRDRRARCVQGGAVRPAGCRARAHDDSGRAARAHLHGAPRGLSR